MALTFSQKLRTTVGGKAFRAYEVTCDGSTLSINAADLELNYIESAVIMGAADLIGTVSISTDVISDAAGSTIAVTFVGAVLGDVVNVGTNADVDDMIMTAYCNDTDKAEIRLQNESTDNSDAPEGFECRIRKSVGLSTYKGEEIVFGPALQSGDKIVVWAFGW